MLIQFTVGNYRSIREEQTLSMVAGNDEALAENLIPVGSLKWPLLRQVAIYGPNAAGKSNLLLGIESLRQMVQLSAILQEGQLFPWLIPHRLDRVTENSPTTFTLLFQVDEVRYQYEVAATSQRVWHEELTAWPQGRPQTWFNRSLDVETNTDVWKLGTHFKGDRHQRNLWTSSTRGNGLFLSTAVQLNNAQLRPIFHWITQQLIVIVPGKTDFHPALSIERINSVNGHQQIMAILNAADIGIERLSLKDVDNLAINSLFPVNLPPMVQGQEMLKWRKVMAIHKRGDGSDVEFDFDEESDGTRTLFKFAGGWLKALETGATLLVDEIDRSLHPHLARMLVQLFRSKNNPNNAQLIFTTHDTTLLDTDLLRRDQIWFVEKDKRGATQLYSLLEFSPRKHEAVERGYLLGRYGAIPFVTEPRWQNG